MTPTAQHFLALRRSPLLAGVPDVSIEALLYAGKLERYSSGCILFDEGSAGDAVYFILEGAFDIRMRGSGGIDEVRRTQYCGELLGEIALFTHGRRSAQASASEVAVVLCISRDVFFELIGAWPQIAMAMLRTMSDRLLEAEKKLTDSR